MKPREPAWRGAKLGNCRASVDTTSAFLDSRTATEPVISSRLLLPPLRNLRPPLQITRAATHSVPRRTTTVRGGRVQRNGVGGGGGGNRPEPDACLQVQEALTRGSSVERELAYRRPSQFDGEFRLNRDSPGALTRAARKAEIRSNGRANVFIAVPDFFLRPRCYLVFP